MRVLLKWWMANPAAMALIITIMAFSGGYGLRHMSVAIFPRIDMPLVNIVTHDPGVAPSDMERLISRPLEEALRGIPGMKRVASTSVQGLSQVTAQFTWGTSVNDARQLVQAQMAQLAGKLPPGTVPRLENIETTLHEVCGYVLYGGEDTIALRNSIAYDLTPRLMGASGVSSVEILGGDQRAFYVTLDPAALIRTGLSVDDVIDVLQRHNINAEAGVLERSGREYLVRGDARIQTLDDLRSIPVTTKEGTPILLEAVATIKEGRAPRHYTVHGDGVPAVAMIIRKQPGASTLHVVRGVDAVLATTSGLLPPETQIRKFYDQSEIIRQSQHEIIQDLLIGALLAIGVLYCFLGSLRPTLIVAFTLPITFLAVLGIMDLLGLGLNVITMTALALSVGLVVDDAIVVAENIFRHRSSQNSASSAAIEGALEIATADASGTFTTIAAFLPLILVSGLASIFMRPFGLTITTALLISLFLSLTWVPGMFGRLKFDAAPAHGQLIGVRLLHALNHRLQATLRYAFRRKSLVITLAFLSLGLAGVTAFIGHASVLPPIDEGALLIEYILPQGTSLNESNRVGDELDRIAQALPEVSCVYRRTGSPGDSYLIEGVNRGELMIKLKPGRRRNAEEMLAALHSAYSGQRGVLFLYHQPTQEKMDESFSGLPALFGITVYGPDVAQLIKISEQIETLLAKDPGVANIVNNTKIRLPQLDIQLNRTRLAQYGVEPQVVLDTLQAAKLGVESTSIVREKEVVGVWVRVGKQPIATIQELKQIPVATPQGGWIPLSRLADIKVHHVPSSITRLNGHREVTLLAEVGGNIPAAVRRLKREFTPLDLPEGYSINFTGQYKTLIESVKDLALVLLIAVALIYFIMMMQFRSPAQPFIILFTIPLTLTGALVGLFLSGLGVDVSVGVAAITLVGIAVNNSILVIDFYNKERQAGKATEPALLSAVSVRLRPILLTTLTTIAALLPVAAGFTVASKTFQPFAVAIIFGLLGNLIATLIVVPTLTAVFARRSVKP